MKTRIHAVNIIINREESLFNTIVTHTGVPLIQQYHI